MPPLPGRTAVIVLLALLASTGLRAQDSLPPLPSVEQQIAASVLALPKEMRDGARVMGFKQRDKLEVIRQGKNGMTCLALFAGQKRFHVACYQNGMEPFMARGRVLRAQGVKDPQVDSIRFKEVKQGKIKMPKQAVMYQLFGDSTSWNSQTGEVKNAGMLLVMYMPGATSESTGLSAQARKEGPWIMYPGTPKAHMMLMGSMSP